MTPPRLTLAEAVRADILHRGDTVLVEYPAAVRSWVQRRIVKYETDNEHIPAPWCNCNHAIGVTGGRDWRGWEMQPPHGKEVWIAREYPGATLYVLRYDGWRDDEQRWRYCDLLAARSQCRYSWSGCLSFYLGAGALPGGRFCSMLLDDAASEAGVQGGEGWVAGMDPEDVTPARLGISVLRHVATVIMPTDK